MNLLGFLFKLVLFSTIVLISHNSAFSAYKYYSDRKHLSLEKAIFVDYKTIPSNGTLIIYGIFEHHDVPRKTIRMIIYFDRIKDTPFLRLKHSPIRFNPGMPYTVWCGFEGDKKFCNEISDVDKHVMMLMISMVLITMFVCMQR
jgi:hypothetical protein